MNAYRGRVLSLSADVRAAPGLAYPIIDVLPRGENLTLVNYMKTDDSFWWHVIYGRNPSQPRYGYISTIDVMVVVERKGAPYMLGAKPWYQSTGVWGSIMVLAAPVGALLGYKIAPEDVQQMVSIVTAGIELVGGALALIGRIRATKVIKA